MSYEIILNNGSRSFPEGDPFLQGSTTGAEVAVFLGGASGVDATKKAVLIELDLECLGEHTGEGMGDEGSNCVGFARYRNGNDAPTSLIELVRQTNTEPQAIAIAKDVLENYGFSVAICSDQTGRIIDRLVRPKYNAALRLLDEGLATASDMDLTCRLGLGYPDGPIERVVRGDLSRHYDITTRLFKETGAAAYAPARRAVVAKNRNKQQ